MTQRVHPIASSAHAPLAAAAPARPAMASDGPQALRPPLLHSDALLRGHRAIEIVHNGVLYRLQETRLGKLILTK